MNICKLFIQNGQPDPVREGCEPARNALRDRLEAPGVGIAHHAYPEGILVFRNGDGRRDPDVGEAWVVPLGMCDGLGFVGGVGQFVEHCALIVSAIGPLGGEFELQVFHGFRGDMAKRTENFVKWYFD